MGNPPNIVFEDEKAKMIGYGSFASFAFTNYYVERKTLKECADLLGVSFSKMRSSLIKRKWPVRGRSQVYNRKRGGKWDIDYWNLVKKNTKFLFPWCALHSYYWNYKMNAKEIGASIGISSRTVYTLMEKYGIPRRRKGRIPRK